MAIPDETKQSPKDETTATRAVESVIAEHPFFAGLTPMHLEVLADHAMRMSYQPGELMFQEHSPANRFYLIESGKVSLEAQREDQSSVRIQIIGGGDVLGWSWLFPPYSWHFDARVLEPTTAIFLYGSRLREQCEEDHDLGYEMMKRMTAVLIQRLQATRTQLLSARGAQFIR